jgi:hypothetical protein
VDPQGQEENAPGCGNLVKAVPKTLYITQRNAGVAGSGEAVCQFLTQFDQ